MKIKLKNLSLFQWMAIGSGVLSAVLIVAGLLFPPPGQIHNSVLVGVGELFAFAALFEGMHAFDNGADVKAKKGDVEIEINNPDNDGKED